MPTPHGKQDTHLPRLISVKEASEQTGLGTDNLYKLIRMNRLPAVRLGRAVYLEPVAVRNWMAAGGTREP